MFSEIDYCHPNPCRHGGTCVELNQAATCSCTQEFKGQRCQGKNTHAHSILSTQFYTTSIQIHSRIPFTSQRKDVYFAPLYKPQLID